jgi:hypothetical protein
MPALHNILKNTKEILREGMNTVVEINDLTEENIYFLKSRLRKGYDIRQVVCMSTRTFGKKTYAIHVRRQD